MLEESGIDPRSCFFATATRPCGTEDASIVSADMQRLHNYLVGAEFNRSLQRELTSIGSGSGAGSLLLQADRQPWHAEYVDRLEWRVEDSRSPYNNFGVEHSFLVAAVNGKQYRMEQAGPYDLLLRTSAT